MKTKTAQAVRDKWNEIEALTPDISTEKLFSLTGEAFGFDNGQVAKALRMVPMWDKEIKKSVAPTVEWSPQQEQAIKSAAAWVKQKNGPQVHYIAGYAGTGKTTLAKSIGDDIGALYASFTGKAASVMRRKGCTNASTIHSLIYRIKDPKAEIPEFELNPASDVKKAALVVVDEVSMVDDQLGKDLLSFGTKILVLGDPAQLPPIKGAGFFTAQKPNTMLTEIHRQARDNPIIRMSMDIREGKKLERGVYGESRVITYNELTADDLCYADQIIVGLNRTRQSKNAEMRELLGRGQGMAGMPVSEDKLVCLRNHHRMQLLNGTIWFVEDAKTKGVVTHLKIRSDEDEMTRGVQVRNEFFLGTDAALEWKDKRGMQEFTYGYALTCHKAQGSQWDNVLVFDEGNSFREDAMRWKYTALTRAAKRLTWVI